MMIGLLKPPQLRPGDILGLVAPCLPVLPESKDYYEQGKRELEQRGFRVKEGRTISLNHWYSASTPQDQANDINAMFADPEITGIVAASGGFSAISVLELLDYALIRKHPKPFIGMSDMTCYHLALYTQIGLVGFHADEVAFGMGWNWQRDKFKDTEHIKQAAFDILTKPQPLGLTPSFRERKVWREGAAKGPLIGGNLNSISQQIGTPYFPAPEAFDGAILFWESVGQPRYNLMRALYQLKYYGALERISGMLIGTITATQPTHNKGLVEPTTKELVLEITKEYSFPIMAGMDFGHYTVNLPMPIGTQASFDTSKREFHLLESAVK